MTSKSDKEKSKKNKRNYLNPKNYFKKLFWEDKKNGEWGNIWKLGISTVIWKLYGLSVIFWLFVPFLIVANILWFNLSLLIGSIVWVLISYILGYIAIIKHETVNKTKKNNLNANIKFLTTILLFFLFSYLMIIFEIHHFICISLPEIFGENFLNNNCEGTYILGYGLSILLSALIVSIISKISKNE